jgi:hypothetical protein
LGRIYGRQSSRFKDSVYAIDLLEILLTIVLSWLLHKIFDEIAHQRHIIWRRVFEPLLNKIRRHGEILGTINLFISPIGLCLGLFYFVVSALINGNTIYTITVGFSVLFPLSFIILKLLERHGFLDEDSGKPAIVLYGAGTVFPIVYAFLTEKFLSKIFPPNTRELAKFCVWESYYYDYDNRMDLIAASGLGDARTYFH